MTTYDTLPDTTRVWIYQAQAPFNEKSIVEIRQHIANFTTSWVSHNNQLRGFGDIYHNQFIVLMVDESLAGASGCSIDKSVHFIKMIEQSYAVNMFDRLSFTYKIGEEIHTAGREEFAKLYQENKINDDTLVFNNLVDNKADFDNNWVVPLKDSWHKRMV